MKKYDKDADGKLSAEERAQLRHDREAKRDELIKIFDKDKDGKLSDEEKARAKKKIEQRRRKQKEEWDRNHSNNETNDHGKGENNGPEEK